MKIDLSVPIVRIVIIIFFYGYFPCYFYVTKIEGKNYLEFDRLILVCFVDT